MGSAYERIEETRVDFIVTSIFVLKINKILIGNIQAHIYIF